MLDSMPERLEDWLELYIINSCVFPTYSYDENPLYLEAVHADVLAGTIVRSTCEPVALAAYTAFHVGVAPIETLLQYKLGEPKFVKLVLELPL